MKERILDTAHLEKIRRKKRMRKIRAAVVAAENYDAAKLPVHMVSTMDEAVAAAAKEAVEGDLVLLSPACASFDAFANFAQRGDHFRKIVMELE